MKTSNLKGPRKACKRKASEPPEPTAKSRQDSPSYQLVLGFMDGKGQLVKGQMTGIMFPHPVEMEAVHGKDGSIKLAPYTKPESGTFSEETALNSKLSLAVNGHQDTIGSQGSAIEDDANAESSQKVISAASLGNTQTVHDFMIEDGTDVNTNDSYGETALMAACRCENIDTIKVLLNSGVAVDARNSLKKSPLMIASESGHLETVKLLVKAGSCVNTVDSEDITVLTHGVKSGNPEIVRTLLEAGAKVDELNGDKQNTALMYTAESGDITCCRTLLDFGADPKLQNSQKHSAKNIAWWYNHMDLEKMLDEAEKSFDTTSLRDAVQKGQELAVSHLLNAGADPNTRLNSFGVTPLMAACSLSGEKCSPAYRNIIHLLLNAGADVNLKNIEGDCALHSIAKDGNAEITDVLIKAGADVNCRNSDNETPLIYASINDEPAVVRLLLQAGADFSIRGIGNNTAFIEPVGNDYFGVVKELLKAGYPVNDRAGENDRTPLMIAADFDESPKMISLLLAWGADPTLKDTYGQTAAMLARMQENKKALGLLLKAEKSWQQKPPESM